MVFFALSRQGCEAYQSMGGTAGELWVGAEVLSGGELEAMRRAGFKVSVFSYRISPDESDVVADAAETIREHHPGECVWVER